MNELNLLSCFQIQQNLMKRPISGEELFDDPEYELRRTCECVQRCVERRIFSLNHALELYKVANEQYEKLLSKSEDMISPIPNVKVIR